MGGEGWEVGRERDWGHEMMRPSNKQRVLGITQVTNKITEITGITEIAEIAEIAEIGDHAQPPTECSPDPPGRVCA